MSELATDLSPSDRKEKSSKRSKHEKGEHKSKSKKRHRESQPADGSERKPKRSKGEDALLEDEASRPIEVEDVRPTVVENGETHQKEKHKKKRSKKQSDVEIEEAQPEEQLPVIQESTEVETKKKKKSRKSKDLLQNVDAPQDGREAQRQEKKHKSHKSKHDGSQDITQVGERSPDAMDIDSTPAQTSRSTLPVKELSDQQYPFFTQTISQYLPLHPFGLVEPIQGYADQHLKPLLNRYVPSFGGVLLAYRNPRVGEAPGKGSLTENSDTDDEALLESINEYAVTFGWLTAEVDLFKPSRGAWLEGSVNLQSGGHIGVVCWGMFNASIEAERLPEGWHWVDTLSSNKNKGKNKEAAAEEAKLPTPEPQDEVDDNDETQVHASGYWVSSDGTRMRGGTKLCFRIKNYDVGVSGDYGYLSIEGTMLGEEEEAKKRQDEMEMMRRRKLRHGGLLRGQQKRPAEFSVTKFGRDEQDEEQTQRVELQRTSRPGSEAE
ncbi:hypothetical protein F5Y15DRAFT_199328 [Xylariaceae sp. FL0016]|nr:hypothetical protein F5Y15DRAFT_199328 [Xylariaceae sp. FL0016]